MVAFSGGPDSTALLVALNALKDELKINLEVLHVNHQLRKPSAQKDEEFCIRFCRALNLPIKICKISVRSYCKKEKCSIETGARLLRYQKFFEYATKSACNKIALGHHADDNLETVLINLIRGSGILGLAGIPPIRKAALDLQSDLEISPKSNNDLYFIRPLIAHTRSEILEFLNARKIMFCHDPTNLELGYRRNYLRHKVIPVLKKLNPNLSLTVFKTSEIFRFLYHLIEKDLKEKAAKAIQRTADGYYIIDINKLKRYNQLISFELIKNLLPRKQFEMVKNVLSLMNKPSGSKFSITKDFWAWREYEKLYLGKIQKDNDKNKLWLLKKNENRIPELKLIVTVKEHTLSNSILKKKLAEKLDRKLKNPSLNYELFDKDKLILPLFLRYRQPGDVIRLSSNKKKKLKDLFIDLKIPRPERDKILLLCDQGNILWVLNHRRAFCGLIDEMTKNIIEVTVEKC